MGGSKTFPSLGRLEGGMVIFLQFFCSRSVAMLIYLPKSLRQKLGSPWPGLGTAIAVGLTLAAASGFLGQEQAFLSLGMAQGVALALTWLGGNGVGIVLGLTISLALLSKTTLLGLATGAIASAVVVVVKQGLKVLEFSPQGQRLQDGLVFLLMAVLLGATLTTVGVTLLALATSAGRLGSTFARAWLGSATGILLLSLPLLKLRLGKWQFKRPQIDRGKFLEALVCGGILLALAALIFKGGAFTPLADRGAIYAQWLEYLPFPVVVWASIRFPGWGGTLATSSLALWAITATLQGRGSFNVQSADMEGAMILLQMFFLVLGTTSLLLSVAVRERQRTEEQLQASWERERLLAEVALRVRQSLDLGTIFQTTVTEVRQLLATDRVYIALLNGAGQLEVRAESCDRAYAPLLARTGQARPPEVMLAAIPSQSLVVHHPEQLPKENASQRRNFLRYQVKALLAVPLAPVDGELGMVVVHQCRQPRHWQKGEIRLLEQLSTQVAIAIQQAQLYQRVQQLNCGLEQQVDKRTAQLQEKMLELQDLQEMKAVFVQAICHDLRTSVLGLLMVLKNLQTTNANTFQITKPLLDNLICSGDRQLTLLNALAEEQNAESRPLHLTKETLNLPNFLSTVCQQWRSPCEQHQVNLQLFCDDDLPAVAADAHYLGQVFDNLLGNAIKHNPPGIVLTLAAEQSNNFIRFTLADNGKGMAPEQCENLFRLYLRSRHNQRLTGIGLGCYQSRQIVEAHGGQIGVSSNPGQGSHFWFTLPAKTIADTSLTPTLGGAKPHLP